MAHIHQRMLLALLALMVAASFGCGEAPAPRAMPTNSSDLNAADAGGTDEDDGEGDGEDGDDESGDDGDDGEDGGSDDLTLDEIFAQCGGIDPEQPAKELLNLNLASLPIVKRGTQAVLGIPVPYSATVLAKLTIQGSMQRSVATSNVAVTVSPALAQSQGDAEAKRRSGPATTEMLTMDERVALTDSAPAWDGISCTVGAAKRVTNATGAGTTIVKFSPALPASVTPLPDVARFEAELGQPRTFTGITATVEQSSDPTVPVGSTHTGTVTVRRIEPLYDAKLDDGSSVAVGGDMAYEVAVSFGTPAITAALGLKPSTKFFIDNTRRTYKAIVVDSGETGVPPAVFIQQ